MGFMLTVMNPSDLMASHAEMQATSKTVAVERNQRSMCASSWRFGLWSLLLAVTAITSSCASWQNDRQLSFQSCPWPAGQQVREVLKIAPLGTEREEAMAKLQKAGIQGSYGANQSIFYCDVWRREDSIWHINVALLFDENNVIYATMPDIDGQMVESPKSAKGKPLLNQNAAEPTQNATSDDPFLQ